MCGEWAGEGYVVSEQGRAYLTRSLRYSFIHSLTHSLIQFSLVLSLTNSA